MPSNSLLTDLYQLTMTAGYVASRRHEARVTFELSVRRLPGRRQFLVAAGLAQALDYLETLQFDARDIEWLTRLHALRGAPGAFFEWLRHFRFRGDVWAMPEGTPFFPNEPMLRIDGPLGESQLVETALLAILNFQTAIASKAARVVRAAAGTPVMEFGARRAHGLEAALFAARACHIAGCESTSLVEAGRRFGIPVTGTMAHSWVQAARSEEEAFSAFVSLFGDRSVLLVDTYDVAAAVRIAIGAGLRPAAVRLDSGDLDALSREVRVLLDAAGLRSTRVLVSGDLDEWSIAALVRAGAPIDGFAVGTAVSTSEDAPALGGIYKLVEIQEGAEVRPVMKRSQGKATWPGRKQVYRIVDRGVATRDLVCLADEPAPPGGEPLLAPVMRNGTRIASDPPLATMRQHSRRAVDALPETLRTLDPAASSYRVETSASLDRLMSGIAGARSRLTP
jgi:nicotinate phosphoribosyltransferase